MATVLIPLPEEDFDPTEVAVSWKVLGLLGHTVRFATPEGQVAKADDIMVTGRGLDPWGFVPGLNHLVVMGRLLRADQHGRAAYQEMLASPEFLHPSAWEEIDLGAADGLLLPGGHRARGMRRYLESTVLQELIVEAFGSGMPVAAICHGVLLAARSHDATTSRSVLYGRRTTALTWSLERRAWHVARITRAWDPNYYRTYPEEPGQTPGYLSVQQEVTRLLERPSDFSDVDPAGPDHRMKSSGRARDALDDERPAFVVRDGNYFSARWPGDVHTLTKRFAAVLGPGRDASST